nr:hypothetical protein [Arthrobacter sp. Bi26]
MAMAKDVESTFYDAETEKHKAKRWQQSKSAISIESPVAKFAMNVDIPLDNASNEISAECKESHDAYNPGTAENFWPRVAQQDQ